MVVVQLLHPYWEQMGQTDAQAVTGDGAAAAHGPHTLADRAEAVAFRCAAAAAAACFASCLFQRGGKSNSSGLCRP